MVRIASADGRHSLTIKERAVRTGRSHDPKLVVVTIAQSTRHGRAYCRVVIVSDVRIEPFWDEYRVRRDGMRAVLRIARDMLVTVEGDWRRSSVGVTINANGNNATATWLRRQQSDLGWVPSVEVRVSAPYRYGQDFAGDTHWSVVTSLKQVINDLQSAAESDINRS